MSIVNKAKKKVEIISMSKRLRLGMVGNNAWQG